MMGNDIKLEMSISRSNFLYPVFGFTRVGLLNEIEFLYSDCQVMRESEGGFTHKLGLSKV